MHLDDQENSNETYWANKYNMIAHMQRLSKQWKLKQRKNMAQDMFKGVVINVNG